MIDLARAGHLDQLLVDRPVRDDRGGSLEAIASAGDDVDHVDLDDRVVAEVLHGPGRAQIGEDQVIVVPDRGRPLRRQIRAAIGTDGGNEAQLLLPNDALHVFGQNAHLVPLFFNFRTSFADLVSSPLAPPTAILRIVFAHLLTCRISGFF